MIDLYALMPIILIIFAYLSFMLLTVYVRKDMSIANFVWGGGVALIALCTLAKGNHLSIIVLSVLLSCLVCLVYMPSYAKLDRFLERYQQLLLILIIILMVAFFLGAFRHLAIIRSFLATSLTCFWASRMVAHLYCRYTGKDPRFTTWRELEGNKALVMHTAYIFGPQVLLMLIMSVPIIMINTHSGPGLNLLDYIGLILWTFGFLFESVSDYQLFAFTSNPANQGKIMRYGLWRYSRHPNYFGEVVLWLGMFCLALSVPGGWVAIVAPVTIVTLLVAGTGAPWTEKALAGNPDFVDYKNRTSFFIPWFVKEE